MRWPRPLLATQSTLKLIPPPGPKDQGPNPQDTITFRNVHFTVLYFYIEIPQDFYLRLPTPGKPV